MNRGIIMEVGKRHLIVLTPDGSFYRVPFKPDASIGEEITFPASARRNRPRSIYRLSALAVALTLLLLIPLLLIPFKEHSAVAAYLTMDINPSLELGIDESERVIELRALNQAGAAVITDLPFRDLPLEQVTESIMERIQARPYFANHEGNIVITSIMMRQDDDVFYESLLTQHMDEAVQKALAESSLPSEAHVEVTTLSAPKEVRDEANEQGISTGKMAVYLLAKSQGHEVTVEELKKHSISHTTEDWGGVKAVVGDTEKVQPDQNKKQLQELLKQEKDLQSQVKNTASDQSQTADKEKQPGTSEKDAAPSGINKDKKEAAASKDSGDKERSASKANTSKTSPRKGSEVNTALHPNEAEGALADKKHPIPKRHDKDNPNQNQDKVNNQRGSSKNQDSSRHRSSDNRDGLNNRSYGTTRGGNLQHQQERSRDGQSDSKQGRGREESKDTSKGRDFDAKGRRIQGGADDRRSGGNKQ
ncbi:anti-sigma factor domain-containing protein [Paenibacillus sepulcri]